MSDHDRKRGLAEYREKYPHLLTVRQAAAIAQRPLKTIYDFSHRGLLDGCKVPNGREIRLVRDCFLNFLFGGFN